MKRLKGRGMPTLVVALVSILIFLIFAGAVRYYFNLSKMALEMKLLSLLGLLSAAILSTLLWLGPQYHPALLVGSVTETLGLALFIWTAIVARKAKLRLAFDPATPHTILASGPYRIMPHPFYTSYWIFWVGWALATWSLWALGPVLFLTGFYIVAARKEEQSFAASALSNEYQAYRSHVGFAFLQRRHG